MFVQLKMSERALMARYYLISGAVTLKSLEDTGKHTLNKKSKWEKKRKEKKRKPIDE